MSLLTPKDAPAVIFWYRLYCIGLAVVYFVLLLALIGVALGVYISPEDLLGPGMPQWFVIGYFIFLFVLVSMLLAAFTLSLFLKYKPWTWVYHLVMICIGFTSPCCIPASVPLLLYWIKADTKNYFGRS